MKLKKLLNELPLTLYRGNKESEVKGLCSHSKRVAPGDLFIAKKGRTVSGSEYITEAVLNGATAILSDMGNPFLKQVAQLVCNNVNDIEGLLASAFFGHPSRDLFTIGVTGTSGKTTTTYLIKHLLDLLHLNCGLIGTIEYQMGNFRYPAELTTPDVIANHKMLREMCKQGCKSVTMEVSSQGLDQGRVAEIEFDVAVFTNLSQDHLDYHTTMESYADAKALLFSSLSPDKIAVIPFECPWTPRIMRKCKARKLTYGFSSQADLYAHDIQLTAERTRFKITYQGKTVDVSWGQIGRYNVLNCLAAFGAVMGKGISLEELLPLLDSFPGIPGRLERVGRSSVFVDYAHKPDALEKVLQCLQEIKQGRIITIFGCGGNRDKVKRPLMGEISERLSDIVIVTSDNPRSEDPFIICSEIIKGFKGNHYILEPDRKKAIEKGVAMAKKEDLILIAGKGHETYQIFAHQTISFDDRKVAASLLGIL